METVVMILAAASLAAWSWLLFGRGLFWRGAEELDHGNDPDPASWPAIVAIIPARNEAEVIGAALRSIASQDYPAPLSIIVVDDSSDDGTAQAAAAAAPDGAIEIVRGTPPPPGWTGKLWALDQGTARASEFAPEAAFVWLTDADIEHRPDTLRRLVRKAEAGALDLVSLMVLLRCQSLWERLLIPPFVFFFRKLYPFSRVNDPNSATAAAAGGCMLLRRSALTRIGGMAAIRNELIDDCALARAVKRGGAIWLGLARGSRSLRAYDGLSEIWRMVTRAAFHQLGYSTPLLMGTVLGMIVIYIIPPLAILGWPWHASEPALLFGALTYSMMAIAVRPTLRLYGQGLGHALLLPVAATLYTAMTVDSARRHWLGRGGTWKSRHYVPQS